MKVTRPLRVLVVDDSAAFRVMLADATTATGHARVVATAWNGNEALRKLEIYQPDVITLDVEMPVMGGLEFLEALRANRCTIPVIVVSAVTTQGAEAAIRALDLGAREIITKPRGGTLQGNVDELRRQMREVFGALQAELLADDEAASSPDLREAEPRDARPSRMMRARAEVQPMTAPQIVAIGSSTGGPGALARVIPRLPPNLPVPVLVVQHMPAVFTRSLADMLHQKSAVRVREATHGELLQPGTAYIAPGGLHMRVAPVTDGSYALELTEDPPEQYCRPSVDYLFRSVADCFRASCLGIILTGMGRDGTVGATHMKRYGAHVIAQNAETSTVFGMPREAIANGVVDEILPIDDIAAAIVAAVQGRRLS